MPRAASVLLAAVLATAIPAAAVPREARGPFLLVALPSLGTVTWRCDPARPGPAPGLPGLALGLRSPVAGATESVRLRAGDRTLAARVLQPGDSLTFPWLRERVQRVEIVQSSGAGTLRATVTVEFTPGGTSTYCFAYLPPRVDVRLLPRS